MLAFTLTAFLELMDHGIVSWDMVSITFIKQVRPPDSHRSLLPCLSVSSGIWGSADTRRLAGLWEDWSESPHRHIARWAPMWASSQARNSCSPRENWDHASQATSFHFLGFHFSSDFHVRPASHSICPSTGWGQWAELRDIGGIYSLPFLFFSSCQFRELN